MGGGGEGSTVYRYWNITPYFGMGGLQTIKTAPPSFYKKKRGSKIEKQKG